jgi:hypothetical protein
MMLYKNSKKEQRFGLTSIHAIKFQKLAFRFAIKILILDHILPSFFNRL